MGNKQNRIIECQGSRREQSPLEQLMSDNVKTNARLSIVLANFTAQIKFERQVKVDLPNQEVYITESIVKLFSYPNVMEKAQFYFNYLREFLSEMLKKKSMILITSQEWKLSFALSEFLMLYSDSYIREFMNMKDRLKYINADELQGDMQSLLQTEIKDIQIPTFYSAIPANEIEQTLKLMRNFIYSCYTMKNKFASEVYTNFTRIYGSAESLLTLYLKLQRNYNSNQGFRRNFYIGAYTLGLGIQYSKLATINLGIKFLQNVIKSQQYSVEAIQKHEKIDPIPKYYYKEIPVSGKNIFETAASYILYLLCIQRSQLNSHLTIKVLKHLFLHFKPMNKEVTYFIQKLIQLENLGKAQKQSILEVIEGYSYTYLPKTQKIRKFISINNASFSLQDFEEQKSDSDLNKKNNSSIKELKSIENEIKLGINEKVNQKQIDKICHELLVSKLLPNAQIFMNSNQTSNSKFASLLKENFIIPDSRLKEQQSATDGITEKTSEGKNMLMVVQYSEED